MSVSGLIELLITAGVIPADKIQAARAAAINLEPVAIKEASQTTYLQVLSPNGGETLEMDLDLAYEITWGSSGDVPVMVSLVPTKGNVCNLTPSLVASKNGSNKFKTWLKTARCYDLKNGSSTPLVSGSYKARISYTTVVDGKSTEVKDDSDANFTLKPIPIPTIKITYPNGGEKLVRNTTYDIKYTLKDQTDGKLIYMSLIDSDGNRVSNSQKYGKSGVFEFKTGSNLSEGAYKIQLKMIADDKSEISDTSDNFFWISPVN